MVPPFRLRNRPGKVRSSSACVTCSTGALRDEPLVLCRAPTQWDCPEQCLFNVSWLEPPQRGGWGCVPRKHCQPSQGPSQKTVRKRSGLGNGEQGASRHHGRPQGHPAREVTGDARPTGSPFPIPVSRAVSVPKSTNRENKKQAGQIFTTKKKREEDT